MHGRNGRISLVDLSKRNVRTEEFGSDFASGFLGGRGLSVKILWDELRKRFSLFPEIMKPRLVQTR